MAFMRSIGVKLRMGTDEYTKDVGKAVAANEKLKQSLSDTGTKAKANMDDIARGLGVAGAGLLTFAGAAVYAAAKFDKQMSEVAAVADASAAQLGQLREAALQAGKDTAFTATEAAKAEAELAKAGVKTADILGGALAGSLALAAAGTLDLTEAATVAAQTMNIFKLKGSDVGHVADVLAASANKSATDVHQMGEALRMGGLVAQQFGLGLEDTAGTLALFADNALVGSDAGTSLKTMLLALASPSDKAADTMKELGISAYDVHGRFIGVEKLAGNLQERLGGLSQAERNAALSIIFGTDAMRSAGILMDAGTAKLHGYISAVNDQGAAADTAAKKMDNLAGDVEKLKGSLETFAIEAGGGATGGLRTLVQMADGLVDAFAALPPGVSGTAVVLAGLSGAALLTAAGMIKLRTMAESTAVGLESMGRGGQAAATGVRGLAKWGPLAAGALGAIVLAAQGLNSLNKVTIDVEALNESVSRFGKTGEVTAGLTNVFGSHLEDLRLQVQMTGAAANSSALDYQKFTESMGMSWWYDLTGTSLQTATENIGAVDDALANLVRTGHEAEASGWIQNAKAATGLGYSELTDALPKYTAAAIEVDRAQKEAAKSGSQLRDYNDQLAASNIHLAGAFGDAANGVDGLINKFHELNDPTLDLRAAQRDAEASVRDLKAALDESGGSLDITTEKGAAAAAAADALAISAGNVAQETYDQTGSVTAAKGAFDKYVGALRTTLTNAGMTRKKVDELINSIAKVPAYRSTTFEVKIKYTGSAQGFTYAEYYAGLSNATVSMKRWGGVTEHARAGLLRDADIYSAKSPARYAFAEPATGGEAFVPKSGNYGRSMSILGKAAGWYGADVVPRNSWYGGTGRAAAPVETTHRILLDGTGLLAGFQREILVRGGDVQVVLGAAPRRP